jgi:hypothetical protein
MGRWQQRAQVDGAADLAGKARLNRLACIGFVILCLLGTWSYAGVWWRRFDFVLHATPVQATLENDYTETRHSRGAISTSSFQVRYHFTVGGQPQSGSDSIDDPPSPTMTAYYHSRHPFDNCIEYMGHFWIETVVFAIICGGLMLSAFGVWFFHRRAAACDAVARDASPTR